ncbi:hypothetical protein DFJ74DRAFT_701627 [Hyaloraphidium curvatum]|nr:hypothetical protein DFJ74DRAFT_701627 [Hyaloraphidium curvatum]
MRLPETLFLPLLLAAPVLAVSQLSIVGEGSASVAGLYEQLGAVYPATQLFRNKYTLFPYESTNSEEAASAVTAGTVDWGATDLPLTTGQVASGSRLVPVFFGGVTIIYNIPELYGSPYPLNLTRQALVGLFNGTVGSWASPLVLGANPYLASRTANASSLARPPYVVVRNDTGSGQTYTLTAALSSMSTAWNSTLGTFANGSRFPAASAAVPYDEIGLEVWSADYSLSYAELATARQYKLPTAALENRAGIFVLPGDASYSAAGAAFAPAAGAADADNLFVSLADAPGTASYPATSVSYVVLRKGNPADCAEAYELIRYIWWISQSEEANAIAKLQGFVVAKELDDRAEEVLSRFRCASGMNILEAVRSDISNEQGGDTKGLVFLISVCIMGGLVAGLAAVMGYLYWKKERERKARLAAGETEEVRVPDTVREKTQAELDGTVNKEAVEAWEGSPPADAKPSENGHAVDGAATKAPADGGAKPNGQEVIASPYSRTTLFRTATGAVHAVVGPAVHVAELWRPTFGSGDSQPDSWWSWFSCAGKEKDREPASKAEKAVAAGDEDDDAAPRRIAEPLALRAPWHRSFPVHVCYALIKIIVDVFTIALNWRGYTTLPPGLLLASVYAALCAIGSAFVCINTLATLMGLAYHKRNRVELDSKVVRHRRRASVDQMAYIQSEIRRLQLVVLREMVTKASMLLREIPLIIVTIVIIDQTIFSQIIVVLGLAANCISLGFKIHSVGDAAKHTGAYMDLRDCLAVLERPQGASPAVTSLGKLAIGGAKPEFSVHSVAGKGGSAVRDALMTLQGSEGEQAVVKADAEAAAEAPQAGEPALLALPFETLSKVVAFMGPSRKAPLSTPSELLRTCRKLARLADDPTTRAQFLVATYGITNVLDGAGRWISLLTREVLGILLRRVGTAPRYQLQRLYQSLTNRFFGFEANTTNTVEVTRFTVLGHVATAIASAIASPWSYPTVVSEKLDRTCPLDVAVGGSQGPRAAMMRMILDALRAEGWLNTRAGHDSLKRCRQFCYEMSLAEALAIIGEYSANKDLLAALERQDVQESERLFSQGLKVEREDILRLLQNPDIMASHELMIKRCPMTLLTAKAALKHLAGASPRMRDRLLAQLLIEQDELRNGPDGQAWVASFFEDERLANLHFLARTFLPEAAAGVQVFPAVLSYDVAVAIKGKQYDVAKALLEMGAPRLQASDLARAMKDRQGTGMVLAALTTCDSYLRHDLTVVLQSAIANRRVQVYNLLLALDRATHPLISPEIMRIPIKSNVGADQSDLFRKCLEVAQREPKIANAWGQTRKMAHKKGGAFEDPFRAYLARYGKH